MAKQIEFNKVIAFDEIMKLLQLPPNTSVSETMKALQVAQNFLQKIHDDAFALGFETGCEANKKIDEI
jgi:hypothetical protein